MADSAKTVFHAREDIGWGARGLLRIRDGAARRLVRLEFQSAPDFTPSGASDPSARIVQVDGTPRHYWVEIAGRLPWRRDLRHVAGHNLIGQRMAVITTDDARRYALLTDAALSRAAMEAFPGGRRRLDLGPAEARPAESQPAESQPAETQTAETRPAEPLRVAC